MVRPVCGGNQGASAGFANSTYLVSDKEKVFSSGVAQAHRPSFTHCNFPLGLVFGFESTD